MASIVGPLHELNMHAFKDAARREGIAAAKREELQSPWVVEVVVYNEAERPCYLATVSDGTLVAWKEMPGGASGDLDTDGDADGALVVGVTHEELEAELANGEFVILEERDSGLGRVKIVVRADFGDAYIIEWRDADRNGNWVWIRTTQIRGDWMSTIHAAIARDALNTRTRRGVDDGRDAN